ncbi:CHASE2 domain-containing protein [uncultured Parasphingorhabdus sp.]|uniref:CHASE2 domain-containing protein n=1 Tax=uncultured Parasphingorhabdus sp. TaxID=2709694 RepID=UPI002AA8F8E5|nr:CHASE2 domain-containing protein [uncultured Parasphingorhabdus sp.]
MRLRQRLVVEWLAVALLASCMVVALGYWDSLSRFDNLVYDQLSGIDRPEASPDIMIVEIDEESLHAFGKWPWPRERHAQFFEQLAIGTPRATGFDVLLSEPGEPEGDQLLAQAMADLPNLFLPLHFVFPGSNGAEFDVRQPIAPFTAAATGLGHVNLLFDADGVVRRANLCFGDKDAGAEWPHLMEIIYQAVEGDMSPAFDRLDDCDQSLLMPYADRGAYQSISYAALAKGQVPPAFVQDKIILIGATANGMGDQYPVPLGDGGTMAGVEIMANLYSTIARDDFIRPIPLIQQLLLSLLPVWILLLGFWRWRPRTTIVVSFFLIVTILLASAVLVQFSLWFAPGTALLGVLIVYPVWGWRRLQATSDFMDGELEHFGRSKVDIPIMRTELGPVDVITGQAEQLTHAISHVRDLRRFISDALRNLPDPMFITDLRGKVTFVNRLAQTGMEDGAQNLALDDMLDRFVSADDLQEVKDYLDQKSRPTKQDYVEFTSSDGRIFAMRRAPVASDEGLLRGYIHYLADITEVANAAQQREEVLQLLSHDMRAPQAAILALLDGRETDETTSRIEGHARRTLALADNFVGLARIDASEFAGEDILLAELVEEANDSLWPLAQKRGIRCEVEDQSEGAFVHVEPSSLYRSFVNLIDNAIKYSPDGGVVTIGIRVTDLDGQPFVSVAISDQGKGISEGILGQLFERFASDDTMAHSSIKGAGLGLNFVAKVIARHGGHIRGENQRDGGACFTILLPLAPDLECQAD